MNLNRKVYAVFSDPQGGPDFILSHKECQERLGNLFKDDSLSVEETEKALKGWPQSTEPEKSEGVRTHQCGFCEATFPNENALYSHQQKEHDPDGIMFSELRLPK